MSGIGPSIGNDRYGSGGQNDPIYLGQIQKDHEKEKEEEFIGNPKSTLFALVAASLYLKKFVDCFVAIAKTQTTSINTEKALADLASFKTVLEELEREDKSHNPEFTQRLSQLWQNLYENCSGLEDKVEHLDTLAAQILYFVKEINQFPPREDHTLGYYLTEHAGQEWIPFPFMNMLMELHEEHLASPSASQLGQWIQQIREILGSFDHGSS